MLIRLPRVLARPQLEQVRQLLDQGRFSDGKLSAGKQAERVKHNEEFTQDNELYTKLNNIVMVSLVNHGVYQQAAFPLKIASPFYARYTDGMTYGDHVDDPVMGPAGQRYRSDLSITVFLSEPGEYEGGELTIRTAYGDQLVKLDAGDAVMYPSSSLHQVAPVTSGVRLVAVTWLQSMIRDPGKRELLYELGRAREKLLRESPDNEETAWVSNSYVNLVRRWAEV
jgi:PKHD-type hydroxylase